METGEEIALSPDTHSSMSTLHRVTQVCSHAGDKRTHKWKRIQTHKHCPTVPHRDTRCLVHTKSRTDMHSHDYSMHKHTHTDERLIAVRWGNEQALWGMEKSLITVRWCANTQTQRNLHTHALMHTVEVSSLCTHPWRAASLSLFHSYSLSLSLHTESEVIVLCRKLHIVIYCESAVSHTDKIIRTLTCQTWWWSITGRLHLHISSVRDSRGSRDE